MVNFERDKGNDKLLLALIDALGFDVEEVRLEIKPENLIFDGFTETMYDTTGTVNGYYIGKDVVEYKLTRHSC